MLPLITAALSILGNKQKQRQQDKQDLVNASLGAPAMQSGGQQQQSGGLQDILGMLGSAKDLKPVKTEPMKQLDDLGFSGQNAPSDEQLLSDY